jgi:hypothetical protein
VDFTHTHIIRDSGCRCGFRLLHDLVADDNHWFLNDYQHRALAKAGQSLGSTPTDGHRYAAFGRPWWVTLTEIDVAYIQ